MYKIMSIEEMKQIPLFENLKNTETITVVYNPRTDEIIINKDNQDYECIELLTEKYMSLSSWAKRMEYQERYPDFTNTMQLLESIIWDRKRRNKRLEYEEKAKPIMEMLLKTNEKYSKVYLENMEILQAMHRLYCNMEIDTRPDDYNLFMYGYMLGSKAERAKRKRCQND